MFERTILWRSSIPFEDAKYVAGISSADDKFPRKFEPAKALPSRELEELEHCICEWAASLTTCVPIERSILFKFWTALDAINKAKSEQQPILARLESFRRKIKGFTRTTFIPDPDADTDDDEWPPVRSKLYYSDWTWWDRTGHFCKTFQDWELPSDAAFEYKDKYFLTKPSNDEELRRRINDQEEDTEDEDEDEDEDEE